MYIFFKDNINQGRFPAFRWSMFEVCMFNIYIFPFRSKFLDPEMENGH